MIEVLLFCRSHCLTIRFATTFKLLVNKCHSMEIYVMAVPTRLFGWLTSLTTEFRPIYRPTPQGTSYLQRSRRLDDLRIFCGGFP